MGIEFSIAAASTVLISVLETAAPIIGGISTLALAILYWKQHGKLSEQAEILEEQQKIAQFEQTPYLVGPYNMRYDKESQLLLFKMSNGGGGPARGVKIRIDLTWVKDDWSREEVQLRSSRTDVGVLEPNTVYPAEHEVTFAADVSDLTIEVKRSDVIDGAAEIPLTDYINEVQEEDESTLNIRYVITYSDIFGETADPFGRDYEINSPTMVFSPSLTLEDHFEHLAMISDHRIGQGI